MSKPNDLRTKTFTRRVAGFVFFEETTTTSNEQPSERPPAAPRQTSGVESRERLRPSQPAAAGPGIVNVRVLGNVFYLPRKTG